jgi:DNA replication protein DnaC
VVEKQLTLCARCAKIFYHPSPTLLRSLKASDLDGSLPWALKRLHSPELPVIDDFGHQPIHVR